MARWGDRTMTEKDDLDLGVDELRRAMSYAGVGAWRFDRRTRVLRWSEQVASMFGITLEDFDGRIETLQRLCHPEDLEEFMRRLQHALEVSGEYSVQYRAIHPDGTVVWHDSNGVVIFDDDGVPAELFGTVTDITRLKRAEERHRAVVEALPGVGFILDEEGRYVDFFARNDSLMVDSREELRDQLIPDILGPEAAEAVMATIAAALDTDETQSLEYPLEVRGELTWFEARVAPLPTRYGQKRAVVWLAHDVTERHRTTAQRAFDQARLEETQTVGRVGSFWVELDNVRVGATEGFHRIAGTSDATLPGDLEHLLKQLIVPEDQTTVQAVFRDVVRYGEMHAFDCQLRRPDGERRRVVVRARRQDTDDGRRLVAALHDVTDRWEAEERYKAVVSALAEGVVMYAPDGRVLARNASAERLLGGERPTQRMPDAVHATFVDGNPRRDVTLELPSSDGRSQWLSVTTQPLRLQPGAPTAVVATFEDVTDRRLAAEERERFIRALEQKNAELERFTYTVSHDLKSPLVTIRGFLGMLRDDLARGDQASIAEDLSQIDTASARMSRLLAELLELSRVGRTTIPAETVDFAEVVREVVQGLRPRLAERSIDVRTVTPLPAARGERLRLVEVWQNLIDNAAQHMGPQSRPCIEIGAREAEDGPIYFVRDNGRGVAPQYHERIFGLFERLDTSGDGTGVGLALVRRIIEVHKGRVWVESEGKGRGSTFCFTLASGPS